MPLSLLVSKTFGLQSRRLSFFQLVKSLHSIPRHRHEDKEEKDDDQQVALHSSNPTLDALCSAGHLEKAFELLAESNAPLSDHTIFLFLQMCYHQKAVRHVKKLQAIITGRRIQLSTFNGEWMVMTLGKCGAVEDAHAAFNSLEHHTLFAWTVLILSYVEHDMCCEAVNLYHRMVENGVEPSEYTFVTLLKACGSIPDREEGRKLHIDLEKKGLGSNNFINNALISMYGRFGSILEAENIFMVMSDHDAVSWNAMLTAYVEQDEGVKGLMLYRQMQQIGANADRQTYLFAIQACGCLADKEKPALIEGQSRKAIALEIAVCLHADVQKTGFGLREFVGNTLISVYGKCGRLREAEFVFCELVERDVVTWNVLLTVYVELEEDEKALQLYRQMLEEGVPLERRSLLPVLQAYGNIMSEGRPAALEIGRSLHATALRMGFSTDVYVGSTLISMYGKCGNICEAEHVFQKLALPNVVSRNAMLSAYVEQGSAEEALQLYNQMQV